MRESVHRRTRLCAVMSLAVVSSSFFALPATAGAEPVSTAAAADTPVYAIESAKASRTLLLDVAHAGARLVVVGDHGHILLSDDQGKTWSQARVPTRQLLTAVFFVDEQHGWAVGHDPSTGQ